MRASALESGMIKLKKILLSEKVNPQKEWKSYQRNLEEAEKMLIHLKTIFERTLSLYRQRLEDVKGTPYHSPNKYTKASSEAFDSENDAAKRIAQAQVHLNKLKRLWQSVKEII
jgi:hypothetical protein